MMKGGRSNKGNEGEVKGRGRNDGLRDGSSVLGMGREEGRDGVRKRCGDGRGSMLIIRTLITMTIQYNTITRLLSSVTQCTCSCLIVLCKGPSVTLSLLPCVLE